MISSKADKLNDKDYLRKKISYYYADGKDLSQNQCKHLAYYYTRLMHLYVKEKDNAAALLNAESAWTYAQTGWVGDIRNLAIHSENLAACYKYNKKYAKALPCLERALSWYEQLNDAEAIEKTKTNLAFLKEKIGAPLILIHLPPPPCENTCTFRPDHEESKRENSNSTIFSMMRTHWSQSTVNSSVSIQATPNATQDNSVVQQPIYQSSSAIVEPTTIGSTVTLNSNTFMKNSTQKSDESLTSHSPSMAPRFEN